MDLRLEKVGDMVDRQTGRGAMDPDVVCMWNMTGSSSIAISTPFSSFLLFFHSTTDQKNKSTNCYSR